jgi:hypothetical protein
MQLHKTSDTLIESVNDTTSQRITATIDTGEETSMNIERIRSWKVKVKVT